jgi:hypothetical protein
MGGTALDGAFPGLADTMPPVADDAPSIEDLVARMDAGEDLFADLSESDETFLAENGIQAHTTAEEDARLAAIDRANEQAARAHFAARQDQLHRELVQMLNDESDEEDTTTSTSATKKKPKKKHLLSA